MRKTLIIYVAYFTNKIKPQLANFSKLKLKVTIFVLVWQQITSYQLPITETYVTSRNRRIAQRGKINSF